MKKIALLGSTGSIGTQTLEIVREHKDLAVVALAAGKNVSLLEDQIREFQPKMAVLWEERDAADLRERVRDLPVTVLSGMEGLLEIAVMPEAETLVTAIVGMLGIRPTIAAIKAGKTIALANKETLVTAGHIIMPLARECQVPILPVDSEHSAIFQSLNGEHDNRIHKILLTASGGPFRGMKREELGQIRVEDALNHPNWSMGRKITIDSATMVNKGLEVMEARWLFDVELNQIQVVVHPQSVIHSMVEYEDGAVIAQLGTPDMRLPIQYALYYPRRRSLSGKRLDFFQLPLVTQIGFKNLLCTRIGGDFRTIRIQDSDTHVLPVHNRADQYIFAILDKISVRDGFVQIAGKLHLVVNRVINQIVFFCMPFRFVIFLKNHFHTCHLLI